jgi:hypothetical protein
MKVLTGNYDELCWGGSYDTRRREEKYWWGNLKELGLFVEGSVDGMILIKWILNM